MTLYIVRDRPVFCYETIFKTYNGIDWIYLAVGFVLRSSEEGNKHSGPIKSVIFLSN
jgi:hypothetical protein